MKDFLMSLFVPWEDRYISKAKDHADLVRRIKYVREIREREYLNVSVH